MCELFKSFFFCIHLSTPSLKLRAKSVFRKHVCVHVCLWLSIRVLEWGRENTKKNLECGLNDEIISKCYSFIFLSNNYRKSLSCVQLSETPWPQTIQSIEFSKQEYWSWELFPSQGMFQTQGSNPGLWHCRQILYHLSHQGNPQITKHTI